jgi:hypothetical protein
MISLLFYSLGRLLNRQRWSEAAKEKEKDTWSDNSKWTIKPFGACMAYTNEYWRVPLVTPVHLCILSIYTLHCYIFKLSSWWTSCVLSCESGVDQKYNISEKKAWSSSTVLGCMHIQGLSSCIAPYVRESTVTAALHCPCISVVWEEPVCKNQIVDNGHALA